MNKKLSVKQLGSFDVADGNLMASDPCYEPGTWCQEVVTDVMNGTWNASIVHGDTSFGWGDRVHVLTITHEKHLETHLIQKFDGLGLVHQ